MMTHVALFGTGRLGTRLCEKLIQLKKFDAIILENRSKRRLRGTIESLRLYGQLEGSATRLGRYNSSEVSKLGLVIIAVKDRYDPRELLDSEVIPPWLPEELRYIGLSRDIHLVRQVCLAIRSVRCPVLVLTNPVEVMTTLVQMWLPEVLVIGGGLSLDSARLAIKLSQVAGGTWCDYRCPLGGEHGGDMVPLFSLWQPRREILRNVGVDLKSALKFVEGIGVRIVRDLGFTLQDSAVVFSNDVRRILTPKVSEPCTFAVARRGSVGGWPVRIEEDQVEFIELTPSEEERILLSTTKTTKIANLALAEFL